MKKLICLMLAFAPAFAMAQSGGPISVNGGHVTLNGSDSVNLALGGVKQWSSDGKVQTNGGLVSNATPVATATVPTSESGNIIIVPTVAAGANIRLPDCEAGRVFRVVNTGANAIRVWPPTSGFLDAQTTPAPLSVAANASGTFVCTSGTRAYSGQVAPLPTP